MQRCTEHCCARAVGAASNNPKRVSVSLGSVPMQRSTRYVAVPLQRGAALGVCQNRGVDINPNPALQLAGTVLAWVLWVSHNDSSRAEGGQAETAVERNCAKKHPDGGSAVSPSPVIAVSVQPASLPE